MFFMSFYLTDNPYSFGSGNVVLFTTVVTSSAIIAIDDELLLIRPLEQNIGEKFESKGNGLHLIKRI